MTKTKAIREALTNGALTLKQLHEKIGGDDAALKKTLANLVYRKILKTGKGDTPEQNVWALRRTAPPPGQGQEARRQARQEARSA